MPKQRILFLCTHNSSRSQTAEGLLRARAGASYEVFSAGTQRRVVHPLAIKAMQEIGIDISGHRAKHLDEFREQPPIDLVVTVCDEAAEACPIFHMLVGRVHWGFPDPVVWRGAKKNAWLLIDTSANLIAVRLDQFLEQHPATSLASLSAAAKVRRDMHKKIARYSQAKK